jgi:hypothetical protein
MSFRKSRCTLLALFLLVASGGAARAQNIETYATGVPGPWGLAFDPSGTLYVTNHGTTLYKVPAGGGSASAFVTSSLFVHPVGVVCDPSGNVWVADRGDLAVANTGKILKVTPAGVVSLFKGSLPSLFGLTMDVSGNLYAGVYNGQKVIKLTPAAVVSDYGTGLGVVGNQTYQLDFDDAGNLYAGNEDRILRIAPGGSPVTQVIGGLSQAMGFVRWTGDNFIVATFGFGRLKYASPTRGNPAVDITSIALADHCADGPMVAGTRVDQPVFMTLRDGWVYLADQNCSKVRRFFLPGMPVGAGQRTWGAVKAIYR